MKLKVILASLVLAATTLTAAAPSMAWVAAGGRGGFVAAGGYHGGYRGGYYGGYHGGCYGCGVGAAVVGGAIVGAAVAGALTPTYVAPPVVYAPPPVYVTPAAPYGYHYQNMYVPSCNCYQNVLVHN